MTLENLLHFKILQITLQIVFKAQQFRNTTAGQKGLFYCIQANKQTWNTPQVACRSTGLRHLFVIVTLAPDYHNMLTSA